MTSSKKPILCLDFDGVIHSYKSGWVHASFIPDDPVPGVFEFMYQCLEHFIIQIYSSRSHQEAGITAMQIWMEYWARKELENTEPLYRANAIINHIAWNKDAWPKVKPSAFVTIDDRALTFTGTWPAITTLKTFKPWNKQ